MRTILLSIFLLSSLVSFGQEVDLENSQEVSSKKTKKYERKKFIFSFDTRNSFVKQEKAKVFGLKFGLQYDDKFRAGLGIYFLNDSLGRKVRVPLGGGGEYRTIGQLKFGYLGPFYERILFSNRKWEFSLPVQLGFGDVKVEYIDQFGDLTETPGSGIMVFEAAVMGHYKFFRWIGLGAGVGYRFAHISEDIVQENLSSPIYVFKVKLFLGEIYKMVFKEGKKKKAKKEATQ